MAIAKLDRIFIEWSVSITRCHSFRWFNDFWMTPIFYQLIRHIPWYHSYYMAARRDWIIQLYSLADKSRRCKIVRTHFWDRLFKHIFDSFAIELPENHFTVWQIFKIQTEWMINFVKELIQKSRGAVSWIRSVEPRWGWCGHGLSYILNLRNKFESVCKKMLQIAA